MSVIQTPTSYAAAIVARMRSLPLVAVLFCTSGMVSTSCGHHSGNGNTVVIDARDSAAYKRGVEEGQRLLELIGDEDAMHDRMLEIHAMETQIRSRLRQEAGDAYIEGFRKYVTEHNDSLAHILFDKD